MAFIRSSRPTMSTRNACRAGMSNALTMPRHVASTNTCHTRTCPLSVSAASTSGNTIDNVCVVMMMRWRLTRSATAPPIVAKRNTGMSVANEVTPSSAADPVRR